jgi:hypothetical protein
MRLTISGRSAHRHEVFLVHLFDLVLSFVSRFFERCCDSDAK